MRILITGARGMLGMDLAKRISISNNVIGVDIDDFDITDKEGALREIKSISPDIVINTAAFTDVDACETERYKAFKVNRDGVRNVALGCKETSAKLIHISTDYVFDGVRREPYREDDEPHSINNYGRSKLEGEREILKLHTSDPRLQTLIVRTSWLFGKNGKNFIDTILRLSDEKDELRVVNDQVGSPTYTVDLSDAIESLINVGAKGIVHCSNSGECSWYDYAKEIIKIKMKENINIIPITSKDSKRPATRPAYSVLSNEMYFHLTGHGMRNWKDGLWDYLNA